MANSEKKEIKKDLETYKSLEMLASSDGGKILITNQYKKISDTAEVIANSYTKLTHAELLGYCAYLKANLDVLKTIKNAEKNAELAEEAFKAINATE